MLWYRNELLNPSYYYCQNVSENIDLDTSFLILHAIIAKRLILIAQQEQYLYAETAPVERESEFPV